MVQKESLVLACNTAITALRESAQLEGITGRVGQKSPSNPLYVVFTATGPKKDPLIIHNITTAVVVLCGGNLETVFAQCLNYWKEDKLFKINLTSNITNRLLDMNLAQNGMELNDQDRMGILSVIERSFNTNDEKQIVSTHTALRLFNTKLFMDVEVLDSIFTADNEFPTRNSMLKYLMARASFQPASEGGTYISIGAAKKASARSKEFIQTYIEEMMAVHQGFTIDTLDVIVEFVKAIGTPDFPARYAQHLQKDQAKLTTLASVTDLQNLVDVMK